MKKRRFLPIALVSLILTGFFIAALGSFMTAPSASAAPASSDEMTCPTGYKWDNYDQLCDAESGGSKSSCPGSGTWNNTFGVCTTEGTKKSSSDTGATGTQQATTGCNAEFTNPLTWVICPVVGIAEELVRRIDNFIMTSLDFQTDTVFDTSNQNARGYYVAWNSFRILATALLIVAGLFMVTSHALGFEALDAYTIRKVMPRLLIAAIGISLSWPLMKYVIDFFNTLGIDIRNLIYSPFSYLSKDGTLGGSTILAGDAAIFGYLFVFGPGAILSLLATAALAVLVGFLVIVVRDMALIVLIVLAPFAIASYVLPNTQKVWKLWKDNFLGLLLVFPIISAFIAVGHVFSAVSLSGAAGNGATGGGTAAQIIGFIAYFLPYFLLPVAFRLATGVIGTVAGFVNDRHRGAFDRLKAGRGNAAKARHASRMAGDGKTFGSAGRIGSLYRRGASVSTPGSGALSVTSRGRAAYQAHEQALRARHTDEMVKNDNGRAGGDDLAMKLASQDGMTRDKFISDYVAAGNTREAAMSALATTEASFGARVGTDNLKVAAWKARAASVTGYKNNKEGLEELYGDAARMVNQGLITRNDAAASIKANQKRADQSGIGFGDSLAAIQHMQNSASGRFDDKQFHALRQSAIDGTPPGMAVGGRKETVEAFAAEAKHEMEQHLVTAEQHQRTINDASNALLTTTDPAQRAVLEQNRKAAYDQRNAAITQWKKGMAKYAGYYDAASQVAPQNGKIWDEQVMSQKVEVGGQALSNGLTAALGLAGRDGGQGVVTYQSATESLRVDSDWQERRREYGTSSARSAAELMARGLPPVGAPENM